VLERLRNAMSKTSPIRKPMAASRAVVFWMTRSRGARLAQHELAVLDLRDRYHVELEWRRWSRRWRPDLASDQIRLDMTMPPGGEAGGSASGGIG
jgi:hypothetical protein